jgi:predicted lipoprotein with Yx(FWY)xxD motif
MNFSVIGRIWLNRSASQSVLWVSVHQSRSLRCAAKDLNPATTREEQVMSRVRVVISMAGIAAASAVMLAACSGGAGSSTAAAPNPTGARTEAPASTSANTPVAGPNSLTATRSSTLGTIVTDGRQKTLYRFDKDTATPSASHCTGTCAETWPPVIASGDVTLDGVSQAEAGIVTRPDGSRQLTIAGWPVYEYSGDSAPGDVKGQGVGNTWFAVTPDGKKAGAAGQQTPATTGQQAPSTGDSSGYGY